MLNVMIRKRYLAVTKLKLNKRQRGKIVKVRIAEHWLGVSSPKTLKLVSKIRIENHFQLAASPVDVKTFVDCFTIQESVV
jgi:hypothetical protein